MKKKMRTIISKKLPNKLHWEQIELIEDEEGCGILKYCKSIGIEFKIVFELLPSFTLPRDYFNEFVSRIYSKCGDYNAKFYINSLDDE